MSDGPTRSEFDRLYALVDSGFGGIHRRLDTLNGRTLQSEKDIVDLHGRTRNLDKEVFHRRRNDDAATHHHRREDERSTKREVALVAAGGAIIAALIKLAMVVGELAFEALKVFKK